MRIRVGDRVEWVSQSGGYSKNKVGEVIAIVPANVHPSRCLPEGFRCSSKSGFGLPRDHQSYLVKVFGKNKLNQFTFFSKKLYWPLVPYLKLAEDQGKFGGGNLLGEIEDLRNQVRTLQMENADLRNRLDRK